MAAATAAAGIGASAGAAQNASPAPTEADALYAQREDPVKARQAAELWERALTENPKAFDVAWKLSRARYWNGTHGPASGRRADLEAGIEAARTAIAVASQRAEGHFWLAANMGALAESFGMRQGLKYRRAIKDALQEVLRIDPAFQQGSADRALGRWYFKVPGMFGGSKEQSEVHLRKSLTYNPQSTVSWFFLAETLLDRGRKAEAAAALQRVLDAPVDPQWAPEDREWKDKARQLAATLR